MKTNIIINSNDKDFSLLKFALLYTDDITVQIPTTFMATVNLPIRESPEQFYKENDINIYIDTLDFFNEKEIRPTLDYLSEQGLIQVDSYMQNRLFEGFRGRLAGHNYKAPNLINSKMDEENNREFIGCLFQNMCDVNRIKKTSKLMEVIEKEVLKGFKGFLIKENTYIIEENATISNRDFLQLMDDTFNPKYNSYLYQFYGDYVIENPIIKKFTWLKECYFHYIQQFLNIVARGECPLSNDKYLFSIIEKYYKNGCEQVGIDKGSYLAFEAFELFLPNYSNLSIDDILEIRYRANDELMELKSYINMLATSIPIDGDIQLYAKEIINTKISPAIKDLENKIFNLKISTIQKIIRDAKNPLSYTPMLASIFTDVKPQIALAVSLGMIGSDLALELYKQYKDISNNPLYFSIKLKKMC